MQISKIVSQFSENINQTKAVKRGFFHTNPIKKTGNLAPLAQDTLQINSETSKFITKLSKNYRTSDVKINGEHFTKFDFSQMGSNPAFWAKNDKGELYYIKIAENSDKIAHLKEEVTASKLYKLAGIDAPDIELCKLENGKTALKSKFSEGLKEISDRKKVQDAFAADAWLANWDSLVVGNCMEKNDKVFKLDNGGALRFRAQGKLKPNFGDKVDEVITLIDGRNPSSSSTYGSMKQEDLINSFKKVCNISDKDIKATVKDSDLAQTLINRRNYLSELLTKIENTPFENKRLYDYLSQIVK